jgi:hypothetical protein
MVKLTLSWAQTPSHLTSWFDLHIPPKISYVSLGEIEKQTSQQEL